MFNLPQMNSMVSVGDLNHLNNALRKAAVDYQTSATPSGVAGASLSPLVPQSIEGTLASATFTMKELALWPAIPKTSVSNTVHEYNVINEHGLDLDPFISEGGGGVLNLSSYSREFVRIKYMAERRSVTDVATLVNILGSNPTAIAEETERGTLSLMQKVERQLWHGQSAVNALGFDGIFTQVEAAGGDNIYDQEGDALDPALLQSILGEATAAPNYARPDTIYVEPRVYTSLVQQTVNFGRHDQMKTDGTLTFGASNLAINGPLGPVKVKSAPFLYTSWPSPTAGSGHAVPAVAIPGAPATGGPGTSNWTAADAGTYIWTVVGVTAEGGYSAATATSALAVNPGDSIDITPTFNAAHTYYRLYRSDRNGAVGTCTFIGEFPNPGPGNTVLTDNNDTRTRTSKVLVAQHDPSVFEFVRMLDFLRRPLAEVDTQRPFLLMLFGSPVVKVASKLAMIRNVGI